MFDSSDLAPLLAIDRADVLSLYLAVDPAMPANQHTPPAWRIWLRTALDDLAAGESERQALVQRLGERVTNQLADFRPHGKGLAVFATEDDWHAVDLPVPVTPAISLGRPRLAPLLWLLDEFQPYGIVQIDHRAGRLLTGYLGRPEVQHSMTLALDTSDWGGRDLMAHGAGVTHGSLHDAVTQRVDEHVRAFWREVADQVDSWVQSAGIQRLVLGGNDEAVAGLRALLPHQVAAKVVGTLSLPKFESDMQILARVQPLAVAYERQSEADLVDRVIGATLEGGRGALGLDDVLDALRQGRAMTVVTVFPVTGTVFECVACHLALAHDAGACPVCGAALQPRALEGLLPVLAFRTDAKLELVGGDAAARLAEHGGIGALLRF